MMRTKDKLQQKAVARKNSTSNRLAYKEWVRHVRRRFCSRQQILILEILVDDNRNEVSKSFTVSAQGNLILNWPGQGK